MHQPVSPCTIALTRLFNRGGAVELRGLAVVAVIGERAEGRIWGQSFVCEVRELFAGDVRFDDPRSVSVLFRPCVSSLLAGQKLGSLLSFVSLKIASQ